MDESHRTLEERSMVQVSLSALSVGDMVEALQYRRFRKEDIFKFSIRLAQNRIDEWELPTSLKIPLRELVNANSSEIADWLAFHHRISPDVIPHAKQSLRFTPLGTVDHGETIRAIVRDTTISARVRFRIACNNAMEEDINLLWRQLQPGEFHEKDLDTVCDLEKPLVAYWSCLVEKGLDFLFHNVRFKNAPDHPTVPGVTYFLCKSVEDCFGLGSTRYFFNRLSQHQQVSHLECLARNAAFNRNSEVLIFAMKQMSESERIGVFLNKSTCQAVLLTLARCSTLPWLTYFCSLPLRSDIERFTRVDKVVETMKRRFCDVLKSLCLYYHPHIERFLKWFWDKDPLTYRMDVLERKFDHRGMCAFVDKLRKSGYGKLIKYAWNDLKMDGHHLSIKARLFHVLVRQDRWSLLDYLFHVFPVNQKSALTLRRAMDDCVREAEDCKREFRSWTLFGKVKFDKYFEGLNLREYEQSLLNSDVELLAKLFHFDLVFLKTM